MTAVEYISVSEEIVNVFWTNFQHDGAAELNRWNDHLCHNLCLQTIASEDQFKYGMYAKSR
jgi:hypothetical protein